MRTQELQRDRIEIWERRKSAKPSGKDVVTAMIFPLPWGAGVHQFESPAGTITVDMSFGRINPANETQQVVVKGPRSGGTIVMDLINGKGRAMPSPGVEVVFDASRLTSALDADNMRSKSRRGW